MVEPAQSLDDLADALERLLIAFFLNRSGNAYS
jgi:hypothetical protein